jgi:hypothetical protein
MAGRRPQYLARLLFCGRGICGKKLFGMRKRLCQRADSAGGGSCRSTIYRLLHGK